MMKLRTTLLFLALTLASWRTRANEESAPHAAKVASLSAADFGSYTYDGAGNITRIGADQFTYDEYGRIKSSRVTQGTSSFTQSFTYDRYGNILSIATSGGDPTIVPAVDPLTNRINKPTTSTNALGTYDANGNLTSYNTVSAFNYDPLDVMSESTVNGERRVYLYTAGNERVATLKIGADGSVTGSTWTLRDASTKVLRRVSKDAAGVWRWDEDYVYNGSQMLASEVPGNTLQFHLDHLGTPRAVTGSGGVRLATHTYFAFGRETPASTQDAETKKFTGHERDDINLDYMHARYYMPYPGRFLSVDPVLDIKRSIREPQSWNRYSYVVNNPINRIDPDGRVDGNGMGEPLEWTCGGCTRAEQLAESNRIAKGTAIGAAVSLAIIAGPSGWRTLGAAAMNWMRGNPGAVQQATQAIGTLAPGPSSPFASGSITMASGMVKSGGKLAGVLGAIEQGAAGARPGTANAAMEVVQNAVTSQGLEAGVAIKTAPGAAITLQNVGNVTTSIYDSGRIVVKQGEKVVLDLIQKAQ